MCTLFCSTSLPRNIIGGPPQWAAVSAKKISILSHAAEVVVKEGTKGKEPFLRPLSHSKSTAHVLPDWYAILRRHAPQHAYMRRNAPTCAITSNTARPLFRHVIRHVDSVFLPSDNAVRSFYEFSGCQVIPRV